MIYYEFKIEFYLFDYEPLNGLNPLTHQSTRMFIGHSRIRAAKNEFSTAKWVESYNPSSSCILIDLLLVGRSHDAELFAGTTNVIYLYPFAHFLCLGDCAEWDCD